MFRGEEEIAHLNFTLRRKRGSKEEQKVFFFQSSFTIASMQRVDRKCGINIFSVFLVKFKDSQKETQF